MHSAPLILGDSVSLAYSGINTGVVSTLFDSQKLINTYRQPIEVTGLNFFVGQPYMGSWGSAIEFQLQFGTNDLTRHFTPVGLLGTPLGTQPYWNSGFDPNAESNEVLSDAALLAATAGSTYTLSSYRWRFPKATILGVGKGLSAVVRFNPANMPLNATSQMPNTSFSFQIGISITGRYVDTCPRVIDVPYATSFRASSTKLSNDPAHFANPFRTSLDVERFTGRVYGYWDGAHFGTHSYQSIVDLSNDPVSGAHLIRMKAPDGRYQTPSTGVELQNLFDSHRRSWFMQDRLADASSYYTFDFLDTIPNYEVPLVGMFGTRQEFA
jgi:hypothetical protein